MLFNSYEFIFLFLPLLLITIRMVYRHENGIIITLIIFSSAFYAWWDIYYLLLMYFSIAVNYWLGKILFQGKTKFILILAIGFNLLLLIIFKYLMLLVNTSNEIFNLSVAVPQIILPIAISFYTFQQIAFLSDNYTGKLSEYPKLKFYCLFVIFFPQLIAGPIVRWKQMSHQYKTLAKRFSWENLYIGLLIFVIGLFKKLLIADHFGVYADAVFSVDDFNSLTSYQVWVGTMCYGLQIYFDFSAYADMAIGLSRMLGIELPINFMSPYKSRSVIEFWRRWHITLSHFFRDHLYIPLGGNQVNRYRQMINVMITMLIAGMWHGASWAFLLWGAMHGVFVMINHSWRRISQKNFKSLTQTRIYSYFSLFLTLFVVLLAWVPFRVNDPQQFLTVWSKMLNLQDLLFFERQSVNNLSLDLGNSFLPLSMLELTPIDGVFVYCLLGLMAVLLLPNTAELFRPYLSDINQKTQQLSLVKFEKLPYTSPIVIALASTAFVICILFLFRVVEFIYFQF